MSENDPKETPETNEETATATAEAPAETEGEFEFVKDPEFKVDYKGDCAYEVQVTVPPENTKKKSDELFGELKGEAEVPGFRKGKVPVKLLENKFGRTVRSEAAAAMVSACFRKLIDEQDLKPIRMPDVDGLEDAKDHSVEEPLEFTLKFEVAPKCELGDYRGVEVERPVLKIGKKQIDETIKDIQERQAVFESLKANAKAKDGDQVIIDFKGTVDGEEFQGGEAENYPYILGSKRFFPEFEKALEGAKAGEALSCQVAFPEDFTDENLAGKTADFEITVHEIKRKKAPKLDDEFAQEAGYESVDDMREKVEQGLREGMQEQSKQVAEARALQKVIENSTFELPKSVIDSMADEKFEQERRRLMQMRVPATQIEEQEEDLRKEARENAEEEIKQYVVLNEIGEAEGVEVTEDDFEQEAAALGARMGMDTAIVSQYLQESEERSSYEDRIYRRKVLDLLLENAKVTDKEVSQEELEEENEQESEDE